jgi:hypothetical protein
MAYRKEGQKHSVSDSCVYESEACHDQREWQCFVLASASTMLDASETKRRCFTLALFASVTHVTSAAK